MKPDSVPPEPRPVGQGTSPLPAGPGTRHVVLGEMCPQGAGGRPAIAPLVMRGVAWTDANNEIAATVERGSVPRFVVFGVDGRSAGLFDTLGMVDIGLGQAVATGTYVGSSPCTYSADQAPGAGKIELRGEDPKCGPVTRGCGIAVGEITRPDEAQTPTFLTGGACMSGSDLAVDIDGDGTIEAFPIAGVLDNVRAPTAEWTAGPTSTASCKPTFQIYDLKIAGIGKTPEKSAVTVDVLAVADLDADGRRELVLAMRFPTVRTIVVYTATSTPQRLEKAGEGTSFAK